MRQFLLFALVATLLTATASAQPTFATYTSIPISGTQADHIAKGDLNSDGKVDIVAVSGFSFGINDYKLLVFSNTGSGLSTTPTTYNYHVVYPGARAVAAGDVNGDGMCDVVIGIGDSIGIFTQNFLGILNAQVSYSCDPSKTTDAVKIADVDQDGHMDIVCLSWAGQAVVFYGNGAGGFTKVTYSSAATAGWDDLEVGKIGTDSLVSIVEMGGQSWAPIHQVRVHRNRSVAATNTLTLGTTDNMHAVAIGHFSDTVNQIAATFGGNRPASKLAFWRHPASTTTADTTVAIYDIPQAAEAGKFDCYDRDYVATLHGGWNAVNLTGLGAGGGVSSFGVFCPNNAWPDALVMADVNNDGKNDIVTVNTYAGLSVLKNTSRMRDTTVAATSTYVLDTVKSGTSFARHDTVFVIKTTTIDTNRRRDSTILIKGHCYGDTISLTSSTHYDTTHHVTIDTIPALTVKKNTAYGDQVVSGSMTAFKVGSWNVKNITPADTLVTWRLYTDIDTITAALNMHLAINTSYVGITAGGNPRANTTGAYVPLYPGVTATVEESMDFTIGMPGHGFSPTLSVFVKDKSAKIDLAQSAIITGQRISH